MTSSCENNCGKVNKYNDLITNQRCFCDKLCLIFDDCCSDFVEFCPEEAALGNNILDTKFAGSVNSSKIHSIYSSLDNFEYKVVAFCPSDPAACKPPPINQDMTIDAVPVLDLDTGIDYVNAKCAKCNNVINGQYWDVIVVCDDYPSSLNIPKQPMTPDSVQALLDVTIGKCWLKVRISQYRPQETPERRYVDGTILHYCTLRCTNERIINACLNGPPAHVKLGDDVFYNPYCALCIYWRLWPKMEERLECKSFKSKPYIVVYELNFTAHFEYNQRENALVLHDKTSKLPHKDSDVNSANVHKTDISVEFVVIFVLTIVSFSI